MNNRIAKLFIIVCLFTFNYAHSEVYSWVDKDGKKHFGQEVPKEYQKQSKTVDVKPVNSMQATEVTEPPPQKPARQTYPPYNSPQNDNSQNLSSCEQQKRAYENSVSCFARCKNNGDGERYVNNVAACGRCQDMKKPSCD